MSTPILWPLEWPPPRGTATDPCWCNGPWKEEAHHHDHCRRNRDLLRKILAQGAVIAQGDDTSLTIRERVAVLEMRLKRQEELLEALLSKMLAAGEALTK